MHAASNSSKRKPRHHPIRHVAEFFLILTAPAIAIAIPIMLGLGEDATSFGRVTAASLLLIGVALGRWSPSGVVSIGIAALISPTLMSIHSCVEMTRFPGTHNMLPLEIAIYYVVTSPLLVGVLIGRGLKRLSPRKPTSVLTCTNCGYSRMGNQSHVCPECGTPCDPSMSTIDRPPIT